MYKYEHHDTNSFDLILKLNNLYIEQVPTENFTSNKSQFLYCITIFIFCHNFYIVIYITISMMIGTQVLQIFYNFLPCFMRARNAATESYSFFLTRYGQNLDIQSTRAEKISPPLRFKPGSPDAQMSMLPRPTQERRLMSPHA